MNLESFKSGGKSSSSSFGPTFVSGAAIGGAAMTSGTGSMAKCDVNDTSFYCTFVKGFNIFKMLLFVLIVIISLYIVYKVMTGKRKK